MLDRILTGKKPNGETLRPSPTTKALAMWLYSVNHGVSIQTNIYDLCSAVVAGDRSVKKAVNQLIELGCPIRFLSDKLIQFDGIPNRPVPVQKPIPIEYEMEYGIEEVESSYCYVHSSVPEQLSLFDEGESEPECVRISNPVTPIEWKAERIPAAACRVTIPAKAKKEECTDLAPAMHTPCAHFAQAMHTPCTDPVQDVRKEGKTALAEAMERLSKTLDRQPSKPDSNISTHTRDTHAHACPPASKEEPIFILNQSSKDSKQEQQEALKPLITPKRPPKFNAAEREKRKREILDKFPELNCKQSEHVVGTLANMMAYGTMPESVYYQALRDTAEPTVRNKGSFLNHKVQQFKAVYRYSKDET